jgi:four helix bundle protein
MDQEGVMAKRVEELPVFGRAMEFWLAVNAIIERPQVRRIRRRYEQISEANDSITSNLREGFELPSDDAFANFVSYSKGSVGEVIMRLHSAHQKRLVTDQELADCVRMADELSRMMGGFIKYLRRSGFKDRGSYRFKNQ